MTLHKPSLEVWHDHCPDTEKVAREVDGRFPRGDWTSTYPGHGEHYKRRGGLLSGANPGDRAIDYMISSKAEGDRIAAFLVADMLGENRFGTRYVIWYRRIISLTNTPTRWRPYINPVPSRRGTASGDHTNHPHQSRFYDLGYTAPKGSTVPTLPTEPPVVVPGHEAVVSLKALVAAAKADPDRPQGGTTKGSEDDVRTVESALLAAGLLDKEFADDGAYGSSTVLAYAGWQKRLGYSGRDADGIPGQASLAALAKAYRFKAAA